MFVAFFLLVLAIAALQCAYQAHAAPTTDTIDERDDILPGFGKGTSDLLGLSSTLKGLAADANVGKDVLGDILKVANEQIPLSQPEGAEGILRTVKNIVTADADEGGILTYMLGFVAAGLAPDNLENLAETFSDGLNSGDNSNPHPPSNVIHIETHGDAPYSVPEEDLRRVIVIPETFTRGKKPPIILVPGTGNKGGTNFGSNYIKLWQDVDYADPVWINTPGFALEDAQVSAEYVAYAVNYISAISGNRNVNLLGWSQGNLNIQWALKYWPSIRDKVDDFISLSGDFKGTDLAHIICPPFPEIDVACPPAVVQQKSTSDFIATLRRDGGDSAYVPTTSVYTATDEIVQPQSGDDASAIMNDSRGVGVTNAQIQTVCAGQVAGLFYPHEGTLYNALAYALAVDALTHDGPGSIDRLDLDIVCSRIASPELAVTDLIGSEASIPIAAAALLLFPEKLVQEPAIKAYAH